MLAFLSIAVAITPLIGELPTAADELPRCRPAATVGGEPSLARDVSAALAARGVEAGDDPSCVPVRAQVTGNEDDLLIEIVDASGRRVERRATSVASAATVIESWARTELTEGLLERRPLDESPAPVAPAPAGHPPFLAIAAEGSAGSDGSIWSGARLQGCVWLGPVCGGVVLRFAIDPGWTGDAEKTRGNRLAADMLAAVELPARGPRLVIAPGLGAGFGWTRARGGSLELEGGESDDQRTVEHTGVRLEAHLRLATPITNGVWLTVTASASFSPSAHTEISVFPESRVAGEPIGFARLALGISTREWP